MAATDIFAVINELIGIFDKQYPAQPNPTTISVDLSQWKWRDSDDNEQKSTRSKMIIRPIIISHLTDFNTNNYHKCNP